MKKIVELFNWSLEDIVKVILGSILFCIAVNIFIVPNHLYTGGVLGIAQLIRSITKELFNINNSYDYSGIIYYLINIPLFILAFRNLGKSFFARTVFAVTLQAILLSLIPTKLLIENNVLTNALVGGILGGIGVGLTLNSGASTGGSDIIGLVLAKKNNNFSVGKIGLFVNIFIYTIKKIENSTYIKTIPTVKYTSKDTATAKPPYSAYLRSLQTVRSRSKALISPYPTNELLPFGAAYISIPFRSVIRNTVIE